MMSFPHRRLQGEGRCVMRAEIAPHTSFRMNGSSGLGRGVAGKNRGQDV